MKQLLFLAKFTWDQVGGKTEVPSNRNMKSTTQPEMEPAANQNSREKLRPGGPNYRYISSSTCPSNSLERNIFQPIGKVKLPQKRRNGVRKYLQWSNKQHGKGWSDWLSTLVLRLRIILHTSHLNSYSSCHCKNKHDINEFPNLIPTTVINCLHLFKIPNQTRRRSTRKKNARSRYFSSRSPLQGLNWKRHRWMQRRPGVHEDRIPGEMIQEMEPVLTRFDRSNPKDLCFEQRESFIWIFFYSWWLRTSYFFCQDLPGLPIWRRLAGPECE